jgi:chitinase
MRAFELSAAALALGSLIAPGLAVSSNKFYSSRHACPQTCSVLGNETSNWTVYTWADRLKACDETMLVNFNIHNSLDNPSKRVKISACVSDSNSTVAQRNDLNSTLNTTNGTTQTTADVEILAVGSGTSAKTTNIVDAAAQLQQAIVSGPENAQTIRFAFSNGAVIGVYAGKNIDSATTNSLLQSLSDRVSSGKTADTTIMQVCGEGRNANNVLGVVADTTGSALSSVQGVVAEWTNATCIELSSADVSSSTITLTSTLTLKQRDASRVVLPRASSTCSTVQVVSGDSCSSLVSTFPLIHVFYVTLAVRIC